jgi:hypothetical protein
MGHEAQFNTGTMLDLKEPHTPSMGFRGRGHNR